MSEVGGEETSSASGLSRMQLNDQKAGMEGLDKEKINQIIIDASRGSKFYENERKKEEQTHERIVRLKEHAGKLTVADRRRALREVDKMIEELEETRDLSRTIVHVDMDMFYAAVEMRNDPRLRDKPVAVGGNSMLSTSNYIARRYGVRAAMPGFIAKKLCPDLVIVKPNYREYTRVSHQVRDILSEYDPNLSAASLDEAYLDITDYLDERLKGCHHYRHKGCHDNPQNGSNEGKLKKLNDEESDVEEGKCCYGNLRVVDDVGCRGNLVCSTDRTCSVGLSTIKEQDSCHRSLVGCGAYSKCSDELMDNSWMNEFDLLDPMSGGDTQFSVEDYRETSDYHEPVKSPTIQIKTPLAEVTDCVTVSKKDEEICEQTSYKFGNLVEEVVGEMRRKIFEKTGLTASAGMAPNRLLAKVCSDQNKPNGQFYLRAEREEVIMFVRSLPVRKISGVGKVTSQILDSIGVTTCQQLYDQRDLLYLVFSSISFQFFLNISLGIGSSSVSNDYDRKSMSVERTFREISRPSELYEKCQQLCWDLANDLQDEGLKGHTVTIKLKLTTFEIRQRATSLTKATNNHNEIFEAAVSALRAEMKACHPEPLRLRLMGMRMSNFEHLEKGQKTILSLFENKQDEDGHHKREAPCFSCPICLKDQDFSVSSLASVNSHVDLCLSGQTEAKQISVDGKQQTKRKNSKSVEGVRKKVTLFSYWK